VSFLNREGDLLVSHEQRLSLIYYKTYWTDTFDYYRIKRPEGIVVKEEPTGDNEAWAEPIFSNYKVKEVLITEQIFDEMKDKHNQEEERDSNNVQNLLHPRKKSSHQVNIDKRAL